MNPSPLGEYRGSLINPSPSGRGWRAAPGEGSEMKKSSNLVKNP